MFFFCDERLFYNFITCYCPVRPIYSYHNIQRNAQAKYDEAVRTGVGEAAAKDALDSAKRQVWSDLRTGNGVYGSSNHDLVQAYLDRINELRSENTTIAGYTLKGIPRVKKGSMSILIRFYEETGNE